MELAALLWMGDYIHARHVWRRHRDAAPSEVKAALEDWWKVGCALMQQNVNNIWASLNKIKQNHPKPYCDYAQEVGEAVCRRLIPKVASLWSKPADTLLGLPRAEWVVFLEKHRKSLAETKTGGGGQDTTDKISFLESPSLVF